MTAKVSIPNLLKEFTKYIGRIPSALGDPEGDNAADDCMVYSTSSLIGIPPSLQSGEIAIRAGTHHYSAARVDEVHVYAGRQACSALGLLLLSVALGAQEESLRIDLTHPESNIKRIIIRNSEASAILQQSELISTQVGVVSRVVAFVYRPRMLEYQAVDPACVPAEMLPIVHLSDGDDEDFTDTDLAMRDSLWIVSSSAALCTLAELFLNAGQQWQLRNEFSLESSFGYGGVAKDSAEIRLWLPGSRTWPTTLVA